MFKPQQGISTYLIPNYLRRLDRDASFVSIEKDTTHVEAATRMIDEVVGASTHEAACEIVPLNGDGRRSIHLFFSH